MEKKKKKIFPPWTSLKSFVFLLPKMKNRTKQNKETDLYDFLLLTAKAFIQK